MRKFLPILLGILSSLPSFARDFEYTFEGQTITYTVIDEDAKTCKTKEGILTPGDGISSGNSISGSLSIPSKASDGITEYTVIEIGVLSFTYNTELKSITIPNSVTTIGEYAFAGCNNIPEINLPSSLNTIDAGAFWSCTLLPSVTIPKSITTIGNDAFSDCENLTDIYFYADSCIWKDSDIISSSFVSPIFSEAVNNVTFGENVKCIPNYAFYGCSNISTITLPQTLKSIGRDAFGRCTKLTTISLPASLNKIGDFAFETCTNLTDLYFNADSCTNCSMYAFTGTNISNLVIGENVKNIPSYAFYGLDKITSVSIPKSVTRIEHNAFSGCIGLKKAEFESLESLCNINFSNKESNPLAYAQHLYIAGEEITDLVIPETISQIGSFTFRDCTYLNSVSFPSSLKRVDREAFNGCINLTKTNFASIESLCDIYFSDDTSNPLYFTHKLFIAGEEITDLVIPESVKEINYHTFNSCPYLTSITFPESTQYIYGNNFTDCHNLKSITLQSSTPPVFLIETSFLNIERSCAIYIPENALSKYLSSCWGIFENIKGLGGSDLSTIIQDSGITYRLLEDETAIVLKNDDLSVKNISIPSKISHDGKKYSVESIAIQSFSECDSLKSIVLPNSITSIGLYAFNSCDSLTNVSLPNSLKTIGAGAFYKCAKLESIDLPDNLTTIGQEAFALCGSLSIITIPENISYIGCGAFIDSNLSHIFFNATNCEFCGGKLYANDPYLTPAFYCRTVPHQSIHIGDNVKKIPDYAFFGCSMDSIRIGKSVTHIGIQPFSVCSNLKEVHIPSSIKEIRYGAFAFSPITNFYIADPNKYARISFEEPIIYFDLKGETRGGASNLALYLENHDTPIRSLVIGGKEPISDFAFFYAQDLERVRIKDGAPIGESAFEGCSNLKEICIETPSLGSNAFAECNEITDIYCLTATPPTAPDNAFSKYDGVNLHVPIGKSDAYGSSTPKEDIMQIYSTSDQCWRLFFNTTESDFADIDSRFAPDYDYIAGIEELTNTISNECKPIDYTKPYDIYTIYGQRIECTTVEKLQPGIYIIRQGSSTEKVFRQ